MHHHLLHVINVMSSSHRNLKGRDIAKHVVHRYNVLNAPNILQTLNISKNIFQQNIPIPKLGNMFVKFALQNQNFNTVLHLTITTAHIMYKILSKPEYHMLLCMFICAAKLSFLSWIVPNKYPYIMLRNVKVLHFQTM